jgi:hypothetical protein
LFLNNISLYEKRPKEIMRKLKELVNETKTNRNVMAVILFGS